MLNFIIDVIETIFGTTDYYVITTVCNNCGILGKLEIQKGITVGKHFTDHPEHRVCTKCNCRDVKQWG